MNPTLPLMVRSEHKGGDRRIPMLHNAPASTPLWCLRAARWAGFIAALVGVVVLLGWLLDTDALKGGLPGSAPMKPNTALGFISLGLALALNAMSAIRPHRKREAGALISLSTLAALIGVATLVEYALSLDLRLDELLFRAPH